jgi:serine/threonine-protein kinase
MSVTDPRLLALRDQLAGKVLTGSNGVLYHLRDRIGEGGQGWVFTANWDEPGGFVVIVKVLRPDSISTDALRRFQREAEVLRLLSTTGRPNPHIVRFFDHAVANMPSPFGGEPLILPFTVLEYVHGLTLEQVLDTTKGRGLAVERVRRILRQVVQALDLVHQQKVVHRDLKPSNILLANEAGAEIAKVTDFGLVKMVEMNLQRTTTLAGASLGYAPPEQYEQGNQRVGVRTDVFSLAAIAFEVLAGKPAFPFRESENPLLIVTRILNGPRPALARTLESLAPELRSRPDVIAKLDFELARALSPDPKDRHATVQEFWQSVEPLLRAATSEGAASMNPPAHPQGGSALPFLETVPAYGTSKSPTLESHIPGFNPGSNSNVIAAREASSSGARVSGHPPASASSPPAASSAQSRPSGAPLQPGSGPPRSAEVRVRPASSPESSLPAAWTWRVATRSIGPGVVRSATFAPDGHTAVGVGPGGLARWDREWVGVALPTGIDTRLVRGLKRLRNGDVVLVGDRGLAVRIAPSGVHEMWSLPDRDASYHAAYADERTGLLTLVGDRPTRQARGGAPTVGTILQIVDGRVTLAADVAGTQRLRAVTRIVSGTMLACGDWGTLTRLDGGVAELVGSLCGGHLLAIEALPDGGAAAVGAGGHALYITPRLEGQLEAVQTTRDLMALAVSDDGSAWAGAAQARILRRSRDAWTRMSGDLGLSAAVIAVWAGSRLVRAVCDDGAMIEGQLS